jgi:hypothetical protein
VDDSVLEEDKYAGMNLMLTGLMQKVPLLLAHELQTYGLTIRNHGGSMGRGLATVILAMISDQ